MKETIHLHWAYKRKMSLKNLDNGISICREKGVPKMKLTSHPEDVTCKECKKRLDKDVRELLNPAREERAVVGDAVSRRKPSSKERAK